MVFVTRMKTKSRGCQLSNRRIDNVVICRQPDSVVIAERLQRILMLAILFET